MAVSRMKKQSSNPLPLVAGVLLLTATLFSSVGAQRAIFSLGTKLKQGVRQSNVLEDKVEFDYIDSLSHSEPIDVSFEGFRFLIERKGKSKQILDGSIRGRAQSGRMLAIMGPSGAGKSTVIHALAGRIKESSRIKLFGQRYINGKKIDGDSIIPSAFIEQEVNFFPHMTVKETLDFRVHLELGSRLSRSARLVMVESLMKLVGLTNAADTLVGDAKVRGISGGERKRLSIAVEMISSPSVIFLDEPTSGLDATAATKLVQTLRDLADTGRTVVAVIHQPSQHVFDKFDDLMLVSEGKLMYFGERQAVRSYMQSLGCGAEQEMGTAEHILDCITRDPFEGETEQDADARMERLALVAATKDIDLAKKTDYDGNALMHIDVRRPGPRANIFTQFGLLFQRSFRETTRGKLLIFVKLVQQVTTALIYGAIYKLGNNQASIQDRFGLLSLIAIGSANMAVASSIRTFPREKSIVSSETASNMYRTLPYFIGKAISELPLVTLMNSIFGAIVYRLTGLSRMANKFRNFLGILAIHGLASEATGLLIGAISPNSDVALALFPAFLVINIIFDGKNISEENTPRLLKWVPKVGLIRWGFEGLCINEFDGLVFDASGARRGPVAKTGADALARFGLGTRTLKEVVQSQAIIAGSFYFLSYLGLTLTRQRFQVMREPEEKE